MNTVYCVETLVNGKWVAGPAVFSSVENAEEVITYITNRNAENGVATPAKRVMAWDACQLQATLDEQDYWQQQ